MPESILRWTTVTPEIDLPPESVWVLLELRSSAEYWKDDRRANRGSAYSAGNPAVLALVVWAKDGFGRPYPVSFIAGSVNIRFEDVRQWAKLEVPPQPAPDPAANHWRASKPVPADLNVKG